MAFCVNCGKELGNDEKFCSNCGTAVESEATFEINSDIVVEEVKVQSVPKCFTVFAKVGYIIGLVSFIAAFIPFLGYLSLASGPAGIVFSILGEKDTSLVAKCKKGLRLSIWATVLGFISYILIIIIMFALEAAA